VIKPKFDELIHAPTRLSLVSLLAATEWADFKFLRDSAGLSDSALSKQLTTLEDAGYIESVISSTARGASLVLGAAPTEIQRTSPALDWSERCWTLSLQRPRGTEPCEQGRPQLDDQD